MGNIYGVLAISAKLTFSPVHLLVLLEVRSLSSTRTFCSSPKAQGKLRDARQSRVSRSVDDSVSRRD